MSLFGLKFGKKKLKEEERHLQANNRDFNLQFEYASNSIKTSKYNFFTFLPLNLFEQFQRIANAYFLFLLILQLIPQISSLAWFTTVVPLVLVLAVSGVKDAIDDFNRHKSDNHVNNRPVQVLINGTLKDEKWMNIQVGDIIKLENNNFVTADLLLLSSSEPHSLVYIETAELDGETNLKVKQALTVTAELGEDLQKLTDFNGEVRCEAPNNKLDNFTGTLALRGEKYALDNEKMLLRGCTIRNTEWCFGLVIYAGPDTKLMQNSGRTTFKRTSIDRLMNVLVLMIFVFLAVMCLILAIGNCIWESDKGYHFQVYLPWAEDVTSAPFSAFLMFWSYVIILNTVVPISLYVSVEIIRLGNSFYIDWDRKMYYPLNDTPAQARTTTLNEELGQIKYIFSDKTGTLTQNIMCFNKCSINGKSYGDVYDMSGQRIEINENTEKVDFSYNQLADPKFVFYDHSLVEAVKLNDVPTHKFFRLLSLCHTVMPEEKKEGNLVYQAQSPDEGALVTAARNFGFVFRARTPETITVVEMGETKIYKLLAILDFNNVRKRMSVIVRSPEGDLTLYCKGADTILYELLHPSCESLKEETTEHLNEFAGEGLRTLVVAYKNLDEEYFQDWIKRHHEASTALEGREDKLSEIYEEIEKDLMLLGATAIEDKLQDGVPQTIETLGKASIKIWVLTGDKQETAMNIGYSCNLLYDDMADVFVIEGSSSEDVLNELRNARKKMKPDSFLDSDEINIQIEKSSKNLKLLPDEQANGVYGLVINGHSLAYALEGNLELELVRTACMCKVVICCRVTPLQKAQVVELVKKYKKAVTLAIGDGANDVSMIKTAHIGVGISGQEGMQAVLSSDFSFAQFRYLQRLLLVHGRWSYIRMCKFLKYFFYKNFAFTLVHFWYGFFSGFSAQTVYDQWFITLYNLMYTSLPVLGMSLFDQDVDDRWSLLFPQLYVPGQQNLYFNKIVFIKCMLQGIYSSLILFFIPYGAMYNTMRSDGKAIADYQSFALMAQTCLLIVVSVQIGLDTSYWTVVNQFFIWGSLSVYFAITFTMYSDGMYLIFTASFPFVGTARNTLSQPNVWLAIFLSIALCVLPVVGFRFLKALLRPTASDKVLLKIKEAKKRPPPPSPKRRLRRTSTRRSGYAFSHQHGFGALIMSGRNMRPKSPFATTGTFSPNSDKYKHKGL
ncbi:phospholipid-transporting ATPase ID isoform X1 [Gallus gallus]|uniref:Phospholipid-transporting ATPase n=2 Tax=Gallus gallus TaxID=9031 RepID=E1BVN3_CHICK|nr:phospholipid-transporting ATPase ID isoform X1 [Gallus gallus]XP_004937187.2 phospholipid-transporting ATPase ID isoform X1 [Gallus gallus]XP_040512427.1 phospholipid-transporting ATPase ID isoform X1 [Gallus gallus]XP_046792228.1 phospholipid-transporting ATPase ID isoform X1 [Gallus gallus]XP_046792229.1 phospholipid-transporting ATPase ID isoform X1 [Gallus gallus]XP_046792230.1 phospholipid-transporting ATPase ID isoform X1 [Gallus gallus]XP_046792231.1 phospholipid-transporting ATPase|eukprot:XP_004937186.2 phospholipid-transporting ATPase ID isoform X2 [Gallus gallus]